MVVRVASASLSVIAATAALVVVAVQGAPVSSRSTTDVVVQNVNVTTQGVNQCLDVQNGNVTDGTPIVTATCANETLTQQWHFAKADVDGFQVLTNNQTCFDVQNGTAINGTKVQAWKCSPSNANQFWQVDGHALRWNASSFCLDVTNGTAAKFPDQTPMQIWTCDENNSNQNFTTLLQNVVVPPSDAEDDVVSTTTSTTTTSTSSTYADKAFQNDKAFDSSRKRMLAWGYDNSAAPLMAYGSKVGFYYHWENDVIPEMPSRLTFIPNYWGTSKKAQWQAVKRTLGSSVPAAVMGFNEPDVKTQANMDPYAAAQEYYEEITQVYGTKGSKLISPSVAWDVDGWLTPFMKQCDKLNCNIDAVGYHMYLSMSRDGQGDVDNLIKVMDKRITYLYNKFQKPIVLGELGLTQAGGGSDAQLTEFMQKSAAYLDNNPNVLAWGLSAVFRKGSGWDNFLNSSLAFFDIFGALTSLAKSYMNQSF